MGYDLYVLTSRSSTIPDEEAYFRANIFEMELLLGHMLAFDMVARDYDHEKLPVFHLAYEAYQQRWRHQPAGGACRPEAEWMSSPECQALNRWRPFDLCAPTELGMPQPGIALHKLRSNSLWTVTHYECRDALSAWHRAVMASVDGEGQPSREDEVRLVTSIAPLPHDVPEGLKLACHLGGGTIDWPDLWFHWIEFLGRAAGERGFEVH